MNAEKYEKLRDIMFELECLKDQGSDEIDKEIESHIQCFNDAVESILDAHASEDGHKPFEETPCLSWPQDPATIWDGHKIIMENYYRGGNHE